MAATFSSGGGVIGDPLALAHQNLAVTNFSLVTSPAPDFGTYRIRGDGGTARSRQVGNFNNSWNWTCIRQIRWGNTATVLSAGAKVKFLGTNVSETIRLVLEAFELSSTTYKIRLLSINAFGTATTLGTGSTTLSVDTDYTFRIQGRNTNGQLFRLWIAGVLDMEVVLGAAIKWDGSVLEQDGASSSIPFFWTLPCTWGGTAESDRPGVACKGYFLGPDGTTSDNGYTGVPTGSPNKHLNWDDWNAGGTADDATTRNDGPAANIQQGSTLTTATVDLQAYQGLIALARQRANVTSKTVDNWLAVIYLGNVSEVQLPNQIVNWGTYPRLAATPPGGGAWSQTIIDGLELRHRVVSTNGATCEVSTLAAEFFTIDADPLPGRRRIVSIL